MADTNPSYSYPLDKLIQELKSADWATENTALSSSIESLYNPFNQADKSIYHYWRTPVTMTTMCTIHNELSQDMNFCIQKFDHTSDLYALTALAPDYFASTTSTGIIIWAYDDSNNTWGIDERLHYHNNPVITLTALDSNHFASADCKTIIIWQQTHLGYRVIQRFDNIQEQILYLIHLDKNHFACTTDKSIMIFQHGKDGYQQEQILQHPIAEFYTYKKIGSGIVTLTSSAKSVVLYPSSDCYTLDLLNKNSDTDPLNTPLETGHFLSAGTNNSIKIWSQNNGHFEVMQTLYGHTGYVHVYTPINTHYLISGSRYDKTIRIWDLHLDLSIVELALVRILAQYKARDKMITLNDFAQEIFEGLPERYKTRFNAITSEWYLI